MPPLTSPRRALCAALLSAAALGVSAPALGACTVTQSAPPNNSTQVNSPTLRWTGSADCVQYRVQYSVGGTFLMGDVSFQTPYGAPKQYKMGEPAWEGWQVGAWAAGVWWRVQGKDAAGAVASSTKRRLYMNPDLDDDGAGVATDCDDNDLTVYPGAAEACDGVDDDCDGVVDDGFDADGDGSTTCGGDCDDADPGIRPTAPELCNDTDDDCDGVIDEGYDADGDGVTACEGDCADFDPTVHPGAEETCLDGVDSDCDGIDGLNCPPWFNFGDLVISEVMANPATAADSYGEWFELYNPGASVVHLDGVVVEDLAGHVAEIPGGLTIPPGGAVAFVRDGDVNRNGFVIAPWAYGDTLSLVAAAGSLSVWDGYGNPIDDITWDGTWPYTNGASLSLSPEALDANTNDAASAWCLGTTTYGGGDLGTPGASNPTCAPSPQFLGWGNLQWPYSFNVPAGQATIGLVFGRVYEHGVTDWVGPGVGIQAQCGVGPDGTNPATDESWLWVVGAYNVDADGVYFGDHANDEYKATVANPGVGTWDYAWRYTTDGGTTWLYSDLDGTDNGYSTAQAGSLTVY